MTAMSLYFPRGNRFMMPEGGDLSRLKILFLSAWYPTEGNPVAGIFVREHARAVSLYNDIAVIHPPEGIDPSVKGLYELSDSVEEGIRTLRVRYRRSPIPRTTYLVYLWGTIKAFRRLTQEGFTPDVIHAHIYTAGVPAVVLGKLYDLPVVITEQFSAFPRRLLPPLGVRKARLAMSHARLVLPVSDALRKHIEGYGICSRFQVVPNVVNTDLFYPPAARRDPRDNQKRFLVVALLVPVKGIPYLLQALHQLQGKRQDFRLDIVGDGPSREAYEQMVTDLGLEGQVTFHGLKSKPEVAEFMRRCDVFVLPSVWDSMPVVLIEAMASGKPVVATRVGGIPEMVERRVGLLVPSEDVPALTKALDYMLDHYQEYSPEEIGLYARERYSYEVVGKALDDVYRRMMSDNQTGRRKPLFTRLISVALLLASLAFGSGT